MQGRERAPGEGTDAAATRLRPASGARVTTDAGARADIAPPADATQLRGAGSPPADATRLRDSGVAPASASPAHPSSVEGTLVRGTGMPPAGTGHTTRAAWRPGMSRPELQPGLVIREKY